MVSDVLWLGNIGQYAALQRAAFVKCHRPTGNLTTQEKKHSGAWLERECNTFTDTGVYAVIQSGSNNKVELVYALGKYTDEDPGK